MSDLLRTALVIGENPVPIDSANGSLVEAGFVVVEANDGGAGLKAFYRERPDVVVLDLDLSDRDGFEVLGTVRELSEVPIFTLTATSDGEETRVRALRAGADDCLAKPASEVELLARIEAVLRRARPPEETVGVIGDDMIRIDLGRHRVEVTGVEVELTPIEFRMLTTFVRHPGRVLGHSQLLDLVWGDQSAGSRRGQALCQLPAA